MIIGLRRGAVNTGKWEDDYGTKLFLNLERNGNALGFSASERTKFIEKQRAADFRRHAGVLPVAGLHGRVRSAGPGNRARAGARPARTRASPLACSARRNAPAIRRGAGQRSCVQQVAESNLETLRPAKVGKMVSICPHCVRTIGTDWGEYGASPPIEHHSELLARLDKLPERPARAKSGFSRSLLSGPLSQRV